MSSTTSHSWKFFRAGGFDQVSLESGADLARLGELDQKLWVALACPTTGLEFDARTLALIDSDKDGRIRAPELIAATDWACNLLKNPSDLLLGSPALPLDSINDATPEGAQVLASARQLLSDLGKDDASAVTLEDTADTARIFAQTNFNGDGIVPVDAAGDDATKAVINDIIACLGAETDRSGKPGISQAKADQFFAEAVAYSEWCKKAEGDKTILPIGDATAAAAAAVRAVKAKVDDYFARCRLAAFDSRALAAVNRQESEYLAIAAKDMTIAATEVAGFPLAQVAAGKALSLKDGVNPAWSALVAKLQTDAVKPLSGEKSASLTEADWTALLAKLGAYECWSAGKAGSTVEKLGLKRLREILGGNTKESIVALIAQDKALEPVANAIANVEQLVRYYRDLYKLCINFVNFRDFYDGGDPAIFQVGTLYLDQRSCTLCLPVEDAGRHAAMAGLAGAYLAYCDCVRKGTGEKKSIVAIFSQGDDDNLMVGRNGIFYDRKGLDFDATITKLVSNPISLRQAFWSPYKKLVRLIEEQIAKRASTADSVAGTKLAGAADTVATADKAKPADKKVDVGAVAALGVACSAAGTALAYFLGLFKGIAPWVFPLIILGLMLLISLPSLILAFIQLRKRNLGPILDANGWAVNARAKINVPFGTSLTGIAELPPGATVSASDRFAEKSVLWPKILGVLFLAWWIHSYLDYQGWFYRWTDGRYGKPTPEMRDLLDKQKQEAQDKAAKDKKLADEKAAAEAAAKPAETAPAPAK